jgi:hypothetical protein
LAKGQILCDQVGSIGESGTNQDPDEPVKEHRHLVSSLGVGAGVHSNWLRCRDLHFGRGFQ